MTALYPERLLPYQIKKKKLNVLPNFPHFISYFGLIQNLLVVSSGIHLYHIYDLNQVFHTKNVDLLEWVKRRAVKMMRGLEDLSSKDRLKESEFFSVQKRRIWGGLTEPSSA